MLSAIFKGLQSSQIVHLKLTLVAEDSDVSKLTKNPKVLAKPSSETSFNVAKADM